MYKLLLADDESDIREGLMEVVDFEKYGFAVVGQAANGLEALQLCEKEKPALILSDIRMPLMDGLTMLEKAREALPTARFAQVDRLARFFTLPQALPGSRRSARIDRVLTGRYTAYPAMAGLLGGVFYLTFHIIGP